MNINIRHKTQLISLEEENNDKNGDNENESSLNSEHSIRNQNIKKNVGKKKIKIKGDSK